MRTIKFRVWNTYQKKFENPQEVAITGLGLPLFYDFHEEAVESWNHDCYNSANGGLRIIEQYTGLLDLNGKEIYEGDIISGEFYDTEYHHLTTVVHPVVFNNGAFNISSNLWLKPSLKILGNIYQNPELIK